MSSKTTIPSFFSLFISIISVVVSISFLFLKAVIFTLSLTEYLFKITYNFKKRETGPSGGLTIALDIYNHLVEEDITKGYKIVGTGTIDKNGLVGEIGGVKYKLQGAVKDNADIFIVPKENYEEAITEKNKHNYKINIISVSTFDEAIEKLKNLK